MPGTQTNSSVASKLFGRLAPALTGTSTPSPNETSAARTRLSKVIGLLVSQYRFICGVDDLWTADVAAGFLPYSDADEREIAGWFEEWKTAADRELPSLDVHNATGGHLGPVQDEFLECWANARDVCTPDDLFFDHEALDALIDRSIDEALAGETTPFESMGD